MTEKFVTLPRDVVELALEAMEWAFPNSIRLTADHRNSIDSLRAALEQPQANQPAMTPIAQRKLEDLMASGYTISGYSIYHEQKHQHGFVTGAGLVGWWKPEGVEYPQPLGEQEPVGFVRQIDIEQIAKTPSDWGAMFGRAMGFNTVPVYTRPQPKREPLTDDQIDAIAEKGPDGRKYGHWFARAIEAAHNIK